MARPSPRNVSDKIAAQPILCGRAFPNRKETRHGACDYQSKFGKPEKGMELIMELILVHPFRPAYFEVSVAQHVCLRSWVDYPFRGFDEKDASALDF